MMAPEMRIARRCPLAPDSPQTLSSDVLAPCRVMEPSTIPSEIRAKIPAMKLSTTNPVTKPRPRPIPVPNPRLKPPFSFSGGDMITV